MYKRNPQRQRRYGYQSPSITQDEGIDLQHAEPEAPKKIEDIPFPNELETPSEASPDYRGFGIPNLINFFKTRIHFEEIILIGLIFLLLDEGINSIEEEFLLIILIYILLV